MKNYNEMANDVLRRIEEHKTKQRNRRKVIMPICCFCLAALLGFGMWQVGIFNTTPPDQTIEDAFKDKSPDNHTANNKIVINTLNGIPSNKMNINLAVNDFVEMTREQMIEYYGVDYFPDVPADIEPWENGRSGIFRRDGGTGEVYWDRDVLNFSNEDFTRTVHLEVDKGSNILQDCFYFNGTEEKSVINNVEVLIGLTEDGYYYSEFTHNGVVFLLNADGVTEAEFVEIITSIVK